MTPVASVVVPVFNGMTHLPATITAILEQSVPDLEIVLSDGGSTDGSLEYLHGIADPRVRVIEMPAGTTAAANWTSACTAASGSMVKLVCQDDVLGPGFLQRQVDQLTANPGAVMAIARRDIIDARGRLVYRGRGAMGLPTGVISGPTALRACYRGGTNVLGEPFAVLFRASALRPALPWRDEMPLLLDLDLYSRVLEQGDVYVDHASAGQFRVSGQSWSTRLARQHVAQFEAWQQSYAQTYHPDRADRFAARLSLHRQALLRRAAYLVARMRGSW